MIQQAEEITWVRMDVVRQLSTADGFRQQFEENLQHCNKFIDAYEKAETMHEQIFGARRYSCYTSFAVARSKQK